jgi:hypothetical protein
MVISYIKKMYSNIYMSIAYHLDYDDFPLVINKTIDIPAGCLLYRGYHNDSTPISDLPAHFGSQQLAEIYAQQPNHQLGMFVTNKTLKLLDLRFIIMLLRELLNYPDREVDINLFKPFVISYGLCSLKCQLELLHKALEDLSNISSQLENLDQFYITYNDTKTIHPNINPFEPAGVRLGITNIDKLSVISLKNLFSKYDIDGFIAPQMFSPFHHDNRNREEIIIFSPINSKIGQIQLTTERLERSKKYEHKNIRQFLSNIIDFPKIFNKEITYLVGGNLITSHNNINTSFDKYLLGDQDEIKIIDNHINISKKYFDNLDIKFSFTPLKKKNINTVDFYKPTILNLTDETLMRGGLYSITPDTLNSREHLKDTYSKIMEDLDKL